ncbi:DUF4255 domain-containing protein [Zestomonas carbonaria]|uniref:Pvc16 N-terminal domain-containing protein n=1 Tax=Zestomonas carbonaria TaxID=2762745 RepID=A0A7U7ENN8_9GAMM|nr:DUF4255 domain-containing protein [Pseudomonas carbonaria]CAD5108374.1 hypothetical protein PSEWESI4_02659 [Pseudomonas carbonaria]
MSTALGIAATAAVLQQLLQSGFAALKLEDVLGANAVAVTCIPPERIPADSAASQLNLFLYNQTRNPGWTNLDLPSRDSRGERIANPALALDLHFLIAAYGVADFHAEIMLGAAMQILHDTPGLGREAIREALMPAPTKPNLPNQLQLAGLADQVEQLRITPLNHNTDEVSRIWAALQTPARPSAAYLVSVLLQQSTKSQRTPLPVLGRNLYVVPLRAPRLDRVESAAGLGAPILPGGLVRASGANLAAPQVRLLVNGEEFAGGVQRLEKDELEFAFALGNPPAIPDSLRAGVCTLQLVHPQLMGSPPQPHGGQESNLAAFVLNPEATFNVLPGANSTVVDGVTYRSGAIAIDCVPRIGTRQRVRLLLNEKDPPANRPARAYSFSASDGNGIVAPAESTAQVSVEYRNVAQGNYLARVQVDAGISPLQLGADGRFAGPEVQP